MTFPNQPDRLTAFIALCLALFSMPALAVINQKVEFQNAKNLESVTLVIKESGDIYPAEIQEDDDSDEVVFVLPDELAGKQATVSAIVDGKPHSVQITVGQGPILYLPLDLNPDSAASRSGFFFGGGVAAGQFFSDGAMHFASTSAMDAEALLAGAGVINIVPTSSADDSAFAWDGIFRAGYMFADDSRLSVDFRTGDIDDFGLNVDVSGDIPQTTSIATARSIGTVGIDTWSMNIGYQRPFTQHSNFGFAVFLGNLSFERTTNFDSTLLVDGVPNESMSGGDTLDENVFQYGFGIEWTNRQAQGNWIPTVGVRYTQSADVSVFGDDDTRRLEAYFTYDRLPRIVW